MSTHPGTDIHPSGVDLLQNYNNYSEHANNILYILPIRWQNNSANGLFPLYSFGFASEVLMVYHKNHIRIT